MKNRLMILASLLFMLLLATQTAQPLQAAFANPTSTIFINEIHYDNTGTDAGESVEVGGPAGTDLTGWSLVLYNGNGGASYNTTNLSGSIPDLGGGFGVAVINYPSNGIQNGSPDGLALVDAGSNVVQFLSYEGTFIAVGGPADGMLSTDIGVSETGSGAVGNSLQLTGSGTTYGDFTWAGEQANTFGSVNNGQTFSSGPAADPVLVINEIDYDQPSTDTAEFVEIKNVGTVSANLNEFTLELVNGTGGGAAVYDTIALPAVSLASGDYFVVCANAATVANCDLDDSPDTNFIQNGAPDAVALRFNGTLIDTVSYEGDTGVPYTEGSGAGLEDAGVDGSISRCDDGVDTDQNNVDFVFTGTITPGAENSCGGGGPIAQEVKIHEVQGNGSASPLVDALVVIEGIVVGDFQEYGQLGGFHVQEEDTDVDGDPATSEGVFVYNYSNGVSVGDVVQVTGQVAEYNGLTEITNVTEVVVISSENTLPTASTLSLPVTNFDDFEAYEGMLVKVNNVEVVSGVSQGNWIVDDSSGAVYISNDFFTYNPTVGESLLSITGVVSSFKHNSDINYKIIPRTINDLELFYILSGFTIQGMIFKSSLYI